ncbi:MAG TPA: hypothetical protein VNH18_19965 [Bryobacteraceae bacterium]|nr:hypothetical protein [Bryobacteraceae bacterium]
MVRIGIVLAIAGYVAAGGSWTWICGQHFSVWQNGSRCSCQIQQRATRIFEIEQQLAISGERTLVFQQALQDQTKPAFTVAREQIQKEQDITRELREASSSLNVQSFGDFSVGLMALLVPAVLLSLAAGRLMLTQARNAVSGDGEADLADWQWPYCVFVGLPFAVNQMQEIQTSVLTINKTWFGWSSFCVCPAAWVLFNVMVLGILMVIGYPASLMWCLSKPSRRTTKLRADANDGAWGVGSYVLFLQTWSIMLLVALLMPVLGWIRIVGNGSRLSLYYLATGACLLFLVLILEGRLIWNAVRIRLSYMAELKQLGSTWSSIRAKDPPGDPTKAFLGEQWWSLPAAIFGTLAVLWALIQWSGVSTLIGRLVAR